MTCNNKLTHISGGAFSMVLSSTTSPITESGEPLADVTGWVPELVLIRSGMASIELAGTWLDVVAPTWRILFEQSPADWPVGVYTVGLRFTAPDARVFPAPTDLLLDVKKW
jgi:hypothetical protein